MNRMLFIILLAGASLLSGPVLAEPPPLPKDPIYVTIDHGYVGYWARPGEYLEYTLAGVELSQFEDAYHVRLAPHTGLMLTFADKRDIGPGENLLEAHRNWELAYWRQQAATVEGKNRDDLAGGRHDLMVTEIKADSKGSTFSAYLIAVAAKDGVYVFSISPATPEIDAAARALIASIKLVRKDLDIREFKTAPHGSR